MTYKRFTIMTIKVEWLWREQKSKLKNQFPEITNKDLEFDESQKAEMIEHLSKKLNKKPKDIQLIMETL
jgi:hypothetical protein